MNQTTLRVGTRRSKLAMWQTRHVCHLLTEAWPDIRCEVLPFVTVGDKSQAAGKPLSQIGGKGLFTSEMEGALRRGEIDFAVHSLKDLPTTEPAELTIGAIPARADARDVLIAPGVEALEQLPLGASIGTGSLRRRSQLLTWRPDAEIRPIRGNVDTRLRKLLDGEYAAIVLAAAGVERLGLTEHITQWLPFDVMLPAPGQGALAVQCRSGDETTLGYLTAIEQPAVRLCVEAERSFLAALEGGCSTPIAAYASLHDNVLTLTGLVSSPDGVTRIVVTGNGNDAVALGKKLADDAVSKGALELISNDQ